MKKFLALVTGLFILNCLLASCKSTSEPHSSYEYTQASNVTEKSKLNLVGQKMFTGIIGNSIIVQMTLTFDGNKVSGTCCYYTSSDTKFNVSGEVENNNIKLCQTDAEGKSLGYLEGTVTSDSRIIGTWVSPDSTQTLSFEIQENDTDVSDKSLKGTWMCINSDGELKISYDNENNISFIATANDQSQTYNLCGTLEFIDGVGIYKDNEKNYTIYLVTLDDYIIITTCSENENYSGPESIFDGRYKKIAS